MVFVGCWNFKFSESFARTKASESAFNVLQKFLNVGIFRLGLMPRCLIEKQDVVSACFEQFSSMHQIA